MISAILLGAGESRRMGVNKLSLPWGSRTIFERSLHSLLQSEVDEVIVVINKKMRAFVIPLRGPKIRVLLNPFYKKGMSTSIRRGLRAIRPETRGILIALGDQPYLKPRTVNTLIHAFKRKKGEIIVPTYRGRRGHPVIFDRKYGVELSKLRGDSGARAIIEKHSEKVFRVRIKSQAVVKDIDLWEDYVKALRRTPRK
jgi:molybdenum cofactor cytidylyltransferase